jgi:hypothetical protein
MKRPFAIAVVVIAAGAAWLWWRQAQQAAPATPVSARMQLPLPLPPLQPVQRDEKTEPQPPAREMPAIAVPGMLDGSDEMARTAAGELSATLLKWLLPAEQIRKWVALVDQIADGRLPDKDRPLLFPMPAFDTVTIDGSVRMNPVNFTRANLLIDTLTAIDASKLADYYHAWRPLLESAYRELGKGDEFHGRLLLAIQNVVEAPRPPIDATLARPKVFYIYADPALEKNTAVTKLLWRLGPDNQRRLQEYLGGLMPLL